MPTFKSFTHPLILSLTLLLYFSHSLSLWCVRACVRAFPSFLLSLTFALAFSLRLSIRLSCSSIHTHSRTRSHTLSLIQSLTNAHTYQIFIPIFLAHSHTFLSLSLSLFLSLSLTHIHWYTHTHSHSHTLSLIHSLIHLFIVVACARCVVYSVRTRARSLLSVSLSLPPFLVRFLSDSISFVLSPPSRSLASLPSFSHSSASSLVQLLVTMISIWNSPTLTASAFFHSLARGIFSQMERWRRRIEVETNWWERIGISLYPRQISLHIIILYNLMAQEHRKRLRNRNPVSEAMAESARRRG